jgi:hypothetical protein
VIIFFTSIPIAYYSSKYKIDMDLLTWGAGFGYLGSTFTSVIYASFTFIFFSLEGSIMTRAITALIHTPLWLILPRWSSRWSTAARSARSAAPWTAPATTCARRASQVRSTWEFLRSGDERLAGFSRVGAPWKA